MQENLEELTASDPASASELVAPVWHTVFMLAALIADIVLQITVFIPRWNIAETDQQRSLHSRVEMYLFNMAIEWVIVAFVWLGVRRRGHGLRGLIGGQWKTWRAIAADILLAIGLWVLFIGLSYGIMQFLYLNGYREAPNHVMQNMLPASTPEMILWAILSLSAGFSEELVFRGYFQRQVSALTGSAAAGLLSQSVLFGIGHVYQGLMRMTIIAIYGLMFGLLAKWRNSLRPGILSHAWTDFSVLLFILLSKFRR